MSTMSRFAALRQGLSGADGVRLMAGMIIAIISAGVFFAVAGDVMRGGTMTELDIKLAQWLHAHADSGLTRAMLGLSHLHSVPGIFALTALFGLYLFRRQAWFWLSSLLVLVPSGMLANVLLKYAFGRVRPSFTDPILTLATYSFPSGHAASSTLFYAMLASYLLSRTPDWRLRWTFAAAGALMVALVGLSRLYLGVHYLSDVVAAVAESCTWLGLCLALCSSLRLFRSGPSSHGRITDHSQ